MRWRRRSRAVDVPAPITPTPTVGASTSTALEPRLEKVVTALAIYAQQLDDRLHHLERSIAACHDTTASLPDQQDLLDVQLHSARVAADVARLRVELWAELDNRLHPDPRTARVHALAETIIDLSDGFDTSAADLGDHPNGLAATA